MDAAKVADKHIEFLISAGQDSDQAPGALPSRNWAKVLPGTGAFWVQSQAVSGAAIKTAPHLFLRLSVSCLAREPPRATRERFSLGEAQAPRGLCPVNPVNST